MSSDERTTGELRELCHRLLREGQAGVVIGYGPACGRPGTRPLFATCPEETAQLLWNRFCTNNLAVYLTRPELRRLGRPAVVVKGCDARAVVTLLQENQLQRQDLVIIGMACDGISDPRVPEVRLGKCAVCKVRTPPLYDHLLGRSGTGVEVQPTATAGATVAQLEAMNVEQRWSFWQQELQRCLKCYACRAVCPLCYCSRCFVDKTRPAWTSHAQQPKDLFFYHLVRAFHLAGRCIGCGECSRVCPQGIPFGLLNQKMAREVLDRYGYASGLDAEAGSPLLDFDPDDEIGFFR